MSDLEWDEVKDWFDPYENGSVPDLVVAGTSVSGWGALLALIQEQGWRSEYDVGGERYEVPASAADLLASDADGPLRSLRVWPDPNIEIIFRPWSPAEIIADVSLFEVQGQERLDAFCGFLRLLGRALDKPMALYSEGDARYKPILAYHVDHDRVEFLAGPWAT